KAAIKGVKQKKLPAIDVDFAKKHFDMDTIDELRADVRKRIEREKEAAARAGMGEKLVEELVKANDFPMPEGLITSGAEEALRRAQLDLAMKGTAEDEVKMVTEGDKGQSRVDMARALIAHFIVEHLAQQEKIFVLEDQ